MNLGPHLSYNGEEYECRLCLRFFNCRNSLYDHCRKTSQHAWCERCFRVFASASGKHSHVRASSAHHICTNCPGLPDFKSGEELEEHLVDFHHYCPDCRLYYHTKEQLEDHDVDIHNYCITCGNYFQNPNNLQMHQQKHQPRNTECYGCYQLFKTFSGMLIHLESGNCESNTTEQEIDSIARRCYQSKKYTCYFENGSWMYMCPVCDREFLKLSALYQHVEDVSLCSSISKGSGCLAKLERFIAKNI